MNPRASVGPSPLRRVSPRSENVSNELEERPREQNALVHPGVAALGVESADDHVPGRRPGVIYWPGATGHAGADCARSGGGGAATNAASRWYHQRFSDSGLLGGLACLAGRATVSHLGVTTHGSLREPAMANLCDRLDRVEWIRHEPACRPPDRAIDQDSDCIAAASFGRQTHMTQHIHTCVCACRAERRIRWLHVQEADGR